MNEWVRRWCELQRDVTAVEELMGRIMIEAQERGVRYLD